MFVYVNSQAWGELYNLDNRCFLYDGTLPQKKEINDVCTWWGINHFKILPFALLTP